MLLLQQTTLSCELREAGRWHLLLHPGEERKKKFLGAQNPSATYFGVPENGIYHHIPPLFSEDLFVEFTNSYISNIDIASGREPWVK